MDMLDRGQRDDMVRRLAYFAAGLKHMQAVVSDSIFEDGFSALQFCEETCRKHLSPSRDCFYQEIFEGLRLAFREMPTAAGEREDVSAMCVELLNETIDALKKEREVKKEILFLPYKVEMWDSLESIWKAAAADHEHCNAYVMALPYATLTRELEVDAWHCERSQFPPYVPVLDYRDVDIEKWHPDIIFIHNPYDGENSVTSVDKRYFSSELRKHTDLLIYVPYYATTGGMGKVQWSLPAYENVDYIIVQSESVGKYFQAPPEKILSLGSPKFDRIIEMCRHPSKPSWEWRKKMAGKKVFFYNTTIDEAYQLPEVFLKKLQYVFDIFRHRKDACLLWRPHPLLESTFKARRPDYFPAFEKVRRHYIEDDFGIYDGTPDIEAAITLSDAYIGQSGSSVISLFGVAGKPIFLLNNRIHSLPEKEDWRAEIVGGFSLEGRDWMITQGDKLYHAPDHDHRYHYYCDLSKFSSMGAYSVTLELNGKVYVCPANAQDILIIGDHKIKRRIPLEHELDRAGAFCGPAHIGDYLFLLPNQYPAIVRFDLRTEKVDYIRGLNEHFVQEVNGELRVGGFAGWGKYLLLASPTSQRVIALHTETLATTELMAGSPDNTCGCLGFIRDGDDYWMLPYTGRIITRWNPSTGEAREYTAWPEDFVCHHVPYGHICGDRPFNSGLCDDEYLFLVPWWGNKFLRLHKGTGVMEEWQTPFSVTVEGRNGYFFAGAVGGFGYTPDKKEILFWYAPERQWHHYDMATNSFSPMDVAFDKEELDRHADGFKEISPWLQYGCFENTFNSLLDFIEASITGAPHDRTRQIRAFEQVAANPDGTSGEKIYRFALEKLIEKGGGASP